MEGLLEPLVPYPVVLHTMTALYLFFFFKFHFLSFLLSDSLSQLLKLRAVTHSTLHPQDLVCSLACNGAQLMLPASRKASTSSSPIIASNMVCVAKILILYRQTGPGNIRRGHECLQVRLLQRPVLENASTTLESWRTQVHDTSRAQRSYHSKL